MPIANRWLGNGSWQLVYSLWLATLAPAPQPLRSQYQRCEATLGDGGRFRSHGSVAGGDRRPGIVEGILNQSDVRAVGGRRGVGVHYADAELKPTVFNTGAPCEPQ